MVSKHLLSGYYSGNEILSSTKFPISDKSAITYPVSLWKIRRYKRMSIMIFCQFAKKRKFCHQQNFLSAIKQRYHSPATAFLFIVDAQRIDDIFGQFCDFPSTRCFRRLKPWINLSTNPVPDDPDPTSIIKWVHGLFNTLCVTHRQKLGLIDRCKIRQVSEDKTQAMRGIRHIGIVDGDRLVDGWKFRIGGTF